MVLAGGAGLVLPAVTSLGMSGAREDDAGLTSGLFNTTQQVGMALGLAVLSTLAASRTEHLLDIGRAGPAALTGGFHLAFGVGAGLLAAAFAITLFVLRRSPARPSESTGREAYLKQVEEGRAAISLRAERVYGQAPDPAQEMREE